MKVIILSGKAQSGKNMSANIMKNNIEKKAIIISYASYLKEYAKNIINWDLNEETKPRSFLQEIGDLVKKIDSKFLINRIIEDIEVYKNYFDVIIISDARFVDEIELIKEKYDSIVIRINGKENNLSEKEKNHNTEISLDNYHNYDYVIDNMGTKEELVMKIKKVLEEIVW